MSRASWWRAASLIIVGGLAVRALWFAGQYYFAAGPRYRVESATIALVIAGAIVLILRRDDGAPDDRADTHVPLAWLPVFVLGSIALYSRAIGLGFLSDDYTLRAMAQSDNLGAGTGWFFRPLPLLLWRALLLFGDAPAVLHLLNIALHGLNSFLVAVLGAAMGMRRDVAIGAAALFLTFPALPEAVAWTAGIQDVLMTTMALGAVVLSAADRVSITRIVVICALLMLGFASKETGVCVPVLIALCWMSRERLKANVGLYVVMMGVTAMYLAIRLSMGIASDYFGTPTRYFFKQMVVIAFGTLAAPWRAPVSPLERLLALALVSVLLLLVVHACLTWRRSEGRVHRDLRLVLWVLASIAPVFTLFFVGPTLEGARYLYLASCAWTLVLADLVAAAADRAGASRAFGGAMAVLGLLFAVSVQREIGVWRQAADLRDRVLTDARRAISEDRCIQATFTALPDSVEGAYVFRNGFVEALGPGAGGLNARPGCAFMWVNGRFVHSQ